MELASLLTAFIKLYGTRDGSIAAMIAGFILTTVAIVLFLIGSIVEPTMFMVGVILASAGVAGFIMSIRKIKSLEEKTGLDLDSIIQRIGELEREFDIADVKDHQEVLDKLNKLPDYNSKKEYIQSILSKDNAKYGRIVHDLSHYRCIYGVSAGFARASPREYIPWFDTDIFIRKDTYPSQPERLKVDIDTKLKDYDKMSKKSDLQNRARDGF